MNRSTRQLNIRIPLELSDDIKDHCFDRGWKIDLTCIDFLTLGLTISKNPNIHEQLNKIIEESEIINVSKPDYVALLIKQHKEIEKQNELEQVEKQEQLTNLAIPLKAIQCFTKRTN